jgi:hypothetical protein
VEKHDREPGYRCVVLTIQLDPHLDKILDKGDAYNVAVRGGIEKRMSQLVEDLGIPGTVFVEIEPLERADTSNDGGLRIRVDGRRCWFPLELLASVKSYLQDQPIQLMENPRGALEWLRELCIEGPDANDERRELVVHFFEIVCVASITLQPSVLLGSEGFEAYMASLGACWDAEASSTWALDRNSLLEVLNEALDLRVSLVNKEAVATVLAFTQERSRIAITEALISALASDVIELIVPEHYADRLKRPGVGEEDLLEFAREGMFTEIGVLYPRFKITTDVGRSSNQFSFVINNLPTPPMIGLQTDECLVNDMAERLELLQIPARETFNPATLQPASIVDISHKETLEAAGHTTWDQMGYFILCLAAAMRRYGACFIHRNVVKAILDQTELYFPVLVRSATSARSVDEITRMLRTLVSGGVPVRNMRLILERLLDYDFSRHDSSRYLALDDRVSTSGYLADHSTPPDLVAFVRSGLKREIGHKYARGTSTLVVYVLEQRIEDTFRACDHHESAITIANRNENEWDLVSEAIASEIAFLPPEASMPVLLAAADARHRLEQMVKLNFPRLPVLSYQEVASDLNIQPIARIAFLNTSD